MSDPELAAIKARADAATPAPWSVCPKPTEYRIDGPGERWGIAEVEGIYPDAQARDDAEFIAHAREDIPALVAEVERLRVERDELAACLRNILACHPDNEVKCDPPRPDVCGLCHADALLAAIDGKGDGDHAQG